MTLLGVIMCSHRNPICVNLFSQNLWVIRIPVTIENGSDSAKVHSLRIIGKY